MLEKFGKSMKIIHDGVHFEHYCIKAFLKNGYSVEPPWRDALLQRTTLEGCFRILPLEQLFNRLLRTLNMILSSKDFEHDFVFYLKDLARKK